MLDRIRGRRRVVWSLGLAALLIGFSLAPRTASAITQTKFYTAGVAWTPAGHAFVGVPETARVTLGNDGLTSTQAFASAELTFNVPSSAIKGVTVPTGWSARVLNGTPAVVLLTSSGAAIAPGGSLVVTVEVTPPAAGTLTITTQVKQSNNFSGSGNDFILEGTPVLSITVVAVTLKFSQQPSSPIAQSLPGASPSFFASFCPAAVAVEIDDSLGAKVSADGVPITITYAGTANPGLYYVGAAVVGAGATVPTTGGVATFGACGSNTGLSATVAGTGYKLKASSPAATASLTSSSFDVTQTCSGTCTTTVTSNGITGTVNAGDTTGIFDIAVAFAPGTQLNCDGAVTAPGTPVDPLFVQTTLLSGTGDVSGTITIVFPKSVVNSLPNNGTPQLPVCAGANKPFVALVDYSNPASTPPYQGLLFNCDDPAYVPGSELVLCVQSRAKVGGGAERVVIFASNLSDPSFW